MTALDRIKEKMRAEDLSAILVTNEKNIRYLCGFSFTDGFLVITETANYLVTDFRYFEDAKRKAKSSFEVVMPELRTAFVADVFAGLSTKNVGYEDLSVTCAEYRELSEKYAVSFRPIGDMILSAREAKSESELSKIAAAQKITDAAFSHVLKLLTPQITEIEVALELEYFMRRNGADGIAFETIAVSGDASALPHGHPRPIPLRKGFLTMDFGAVYEGYCSDMTRTVVVGRADAEMRRLYGTVLAAQEAALELAALGVSCAAMDKVARDLIDAAGYKGCFGHSLGHGVGLDIHESPRLSARAGERKLTLGDVVTVEPGIYLEGKYGCRIEDMIAVTKDGIRNFTQSPKELIEIF